MEAFEITIPIRGYLKKFIASNHEISPFKVRITKCAISGLILESLKKDFKRSEDFSTKELNDKFTFSMSAELQKKNRFWMDERVVKILDSRLKDMFDQQLTDFVTINNEKIGDIKVSILQFMDYYGITEDDLPWETVCKMYYRARHGVPSVKQERMQKIINEQLSLFQ